MKLEKHCIDLVRISKTEKLWWLLPCMGSFLWIDSNVAVIRTNRCDDRVINWFDDAQSLFYCLNVRTIDLYLGRTLSVASSDTICGTKLRISYKYETKSDGFFVPWTMFLMCRDKVDDLYRIQAVSIVYVMYQRWHGRKTYLTFRNRTTFRKWHGK